MTLPDLIWPCMTSAKLLWPYPFSWDLSRPFVTSAVLPLVILADLIWPQLNPYDLTRPYMTLCDLSRPPVTLAILMGPQQPFCELRRPSSWDLSQSYSISPQLSSWDLRQFYIELLFYIRKKECFFPQNFEKLYFVRRVFSLDPDPEPDLYGGFPDPGSGSV